MNEVAVINGLRPLPRVNVMQKMILPTMDCGSVAGKTSALGVGTITSRAARLLAAVLLLGPTAFCVAATHEVTLSGLSFSPSSLVIQTGDSVRWRNVSGFHDVVADDGSFTSGPPTFDGFVFTRTFNEPGTFGYYCSVHGAPNQGMAGSITVQASPIPDPDPDPDPTPTAPEINFATSGAWFNPSTSGQGFFVEAFPDAKVFTLAWFTWIDDGDQDWFVASGLYEGSRAEVEVFRVSGGLFNDPTPVTDSVIGTASFTLIDCENATFEFALSNPVRSGSIALQRILPSDDACVVPAPPRKLGVVDD